MCAAKCAAKASCSAWQFTPSTSACDLVDSYKRTVASGVATQIGDRTCDGN